MVILAGTVMQIILGASIWGDWTGIALLGALHAVRHLGNALLHTAASRGRRFSQPVAPPWVRGVFNLILTLASLHVAGWNPIALFTLPIAVAIYDIYFSERGSAAFSAATLLLTVVFARVDGAASVTIGAVVAASIAGYAVVHARTRMFLGALDALDQRNGELSRMQAVLIENEKLASLGTLAEGIAHEINNPMGYVTSNVRTLLADLAPLRSTDPVIAEYVDDVLPTTLDGIQRVNSIVADLRRFARGDPEGLQEFDVNREIDAALRMCESQLKYSCSVERHLGAIPKVRGRPQQIGQVFMNLFVNASQAMRSRGHLAITTRADGTGVRIVVRDDGEGMSPEVRSKIFQPFFTTKPVGKGTGLGLAVAWGIIKSHGGIIEVDSAVGKGTSFSIFLPGAHPDSGQKRPDRPGEMRALTS